ALPDASGPRLGLAALPADAAGQASGILNSCSFLGGTVGVTAGGIALGIAGFPGVLAVIALSALIGAGLCLRIDRAESALQPLCEAGPPRPSSPSGLRRHVVTTIPMPLP